MANDPRPPIPRSSNPQEPRDPLDLLHELARTRAPGPPQEQAHQQPHEPPAPGHGGPGDEKLESLRALTESLSRQLRAPPKNEQAHEQAHAQYPAQEPAHDPSLYAQNDPSQYPSQDPALYAQQDPSQYPPHDPMPPQQPLPRGGHGTWRRTAQFEWAAFLDGLPPARALVPRLRLPEIVFVAIAAVVLAAAALGAYIHHRRALAASEAVMPPMPREAPAPGPAPSTDEPPPPTVADVQRAMSECDAAAAKDPDAFNFLVLPLLRTNPADTSWNPVPLQSIGSAYVLLGANDALDGLRDGKLKVRPGRYTFSVLDPIKGTTYSWTSATQVSRLARADPTGIKTFKLGFDFSPNQIGPQWSAELQRARGTCYWVNVLVR